MAKFTIRYLVERKLKNNIARYYWQPDVLLRAAGWKHKRLSDSLPEAMAEAEKINELVKQWRVNKANGPTNEKPGSVDALIAAYKKSRHYNDLADRTRKDYDHYLKAISEWAGDTPAIAIAAKNVQDLYESQREKSPRKAMYLIQVLRLLFNYAERVSLIPKNSNPATNPGLSYKAEKGSLWSPEDVAHFVKTADNMNMFSIGTAVMLNEWLGQRRDDIRTMSMARYRDGAIHIRQSKTGAEVTLPVDMVPELKARLEEQIRINNARKTPGTCLIQNLSGAPYTKDSFSTMFERARARAAESYDAGDGCKLEKPCDKCERCRYRKLVFKDLRHTAVSRLSEAGAEIPMIAAVTGHTFKSCQEIIDRYNIRTTKMAREAFQRRINSSTGA